MRNLLLIALICLTAAANALNWSDSSFELLQTEALKMAGADITAYKYPDADSVVVDNIISVRYNADGTFFQINDIATKILTEKGCEDERVISSYYSTSYARAKIASVQIIKPTGEVQELPLEELTQEMIDPSQMNANIYDPNHKIIQVSVPGLETGDILRRIFVDEQLKPIVPNSFSDFQSMESTVPICHQLYTVSAPENLPLKKIMVKSPVGDGPVFHERAANGRRIYSWEIKDVPQAFAEPRQPLMYMFTQRLLISTFDSWQEVSKWYDGLCAEPLKPSQEIIDAVKTIVNGETDRRKIITSLFNFVSQQVRYMGTIAESTAPGFEPHDVALTFEQRAGVCRDKAALLATMLRVAGLDAFPVLIHTGAKKDDEVPMPYFNHAITGVRDPDAPNGILLMDATAENTRALLPSYLSDKSYLAATPDGEPLHTTPITPASENAVNIISNGSLDANGTLMLTSRIEFDGINDNAYRGQFLQSTQEQRRQFFEKQLKQLIPGASLSRFELLPKDLQDMDQPLQVRLSFTAPNLLTTGQDAKGRQIRTAGASAMLKLPRLAPGFGLINWVFNGASLEKRRFPFQTSYACAVNEEISLTLPEELEFVSIPDFERVDTGTLQWEQTIDTVRGRIAFSSKYASKGVLFSPEEYLSLKESLKYFETAARKRPILRFTEAKDDPDTPAAAVTEQQPDARILSNSIIYNLDSPSSWTYEENVKMQLLTYSGVQDNSDLQWSYNPAWEELELVSATVTTNGTTQTITPQMIHRMDEKWVASAPRYPAGKTLVANLPGVAIGSVIEYTLKSTSRNHPFFAFADSLRSSYPVDSYRIDVYAPEALDLDQDYFERGWLDLPINDDFKPAKINFNKMNFRNDRVKYTWSVNNVPALHLEDHLPPAFAFLPTVAVSGGNWKEYATALSNIVEALGDGGSAIRSAVAPFKNYPDDKLIAAIRDLVEQGIRHGGPAFTDLPLTCLSRPEVTLRDGYGNSADRAILYAALLRAAGFPDVELFLANGMPEHAELQRFYQKFPLFGHFSEWLVRVKCNIGEVWLNDQNRYAQFGTCAYDRGMLLRLKNGSLSSMELQESFADSIENASEITIDNDGTAHFSTKKTIRGVYFGDMKRFYAQLPPEERRRHYQEMLTELSQNAVPVTRDLITEFRHYPGKVFYQADVANFAVLEDQHCYFTLPVNPAALLGTARTDQRVNPLYWSAARRSQSTITVTLPTDFPEIVMAPADFSWRAPSGGGSISWNCRRVNATATAPAKLVFTLKADLESAFFTSKQYPELQKALERLQHPAAVTVLLSK